MYHFAGVVDPPAVCPGYFFTLCHATVPTVISRLRSNLLIITIITITFHIKLL